MSTYVVIDLEMCKVPKGSVREHFPAPHEIIQIGAVALDGEYRVVDTFSTLVKPRYGAIDTYIQRLTGISANDVKGAPYIEEAIAAFAEWLPEDHVLVTWSDNDVKQICKELGLKGVEIPMSKECLEDYIDCQRIFSDMMGSDRAYRLSEALVIANIDFDENIHDAFVDAKNTALLFAKTQLEDELTLSPYLISEEELERSRSGGYLAKYYHKYYA